MMPYKLAIEDAPLDREEKILLDEKFEAGLIEMLLN